MMTNQLTITRKTVFYSVMLLLAVFTRFANLGDQVVDHDESLHVKFSWDLYKGSGYQFSPIFHGPLTDDLIALSFTLFGDNDFTARIPVAIMGSIIVLLPGFLFEYWL